MRWNPLIGSVLLALALDAAHAPRAAAQDLDEIVITGEFPGPGMWKVTRPGDTTGHVLWIVGDPWALPRRMKWKSRDIEKVALAAQEVLRDSGVAMEPDEKIGLFRGLALVPAMMDALQNPNGERLVELLPPALYARWLTQKKLYLGYDGGVEKLRPLFAAEKLRREAFDDLKLREQGVVWEAIGKKIQKSKIRITEPKLRFTIKRDEVKEKIREFSHESLPDMDCFAATLDLTEALARRDIEDARARAWAIGDLDALQTLPPLPSPYLPCAMALMSSQVARELIPPDIAERVAVLWLDAATQALTANQTTFAVVPFAKLTREGGYLARLRALGLEIEAPR